MHSYNRGVVHDVYTVNKVVSIPSNGSYAFLRKEELQEILEDFIKSQSPLTGHMHSYILEDE